MNPAQIKEKIAKKGQVGTITHVRNTPKAGEPYNVDTDTNNEPITFVLLPLKGNKDISHLLPTSTIVETQSALIAAEGLTAEPIKGDVIADVNANKWTVASSGRLAPTGLNLIWKAIVYR